MSYFHDKTLILDVDGVVLDWTSNLPLFCRSIGLSAKKALQAICSGAHVPCTNLFDTQNEDIAMQLLIDYNESRYGRYLNAYIDAIQYVPLLAKKFNLVFLSSFGNTKSAWTNRRGNLEAYFPDCISDLYIIHPNESKDYMIGSIIANEKSNGREVIGFVDDQLTNIEIAGRHLPADKLLYLNRGQDFQSDYTSFLEIFNKLLQDNHIDNDINFKYVRL